MSYCNDLYCWNKLPCPEHSTQESKQEVDRSLYTVPVNAPIVQLLCKEAFSGLSPREQVYAYHMSRASWQGALICLLQTSPESPEIFAQILTSFAFARDPNAAETFAAHKTACEQLVGPEGYAQAMMYFAAFLGNIGNYKSFGDTKIIPECEPKVLQAVLTEAARLSQGDAKIEVVTDGCGTQGTAIRPIGRKLLEAIYSLTPRRRQLGIGEKEGISTYFSSNCEKEDAALAQRFLDTFKISAYNTRLFKTGEREYQVVQASSAIGEQGKPIKFEGATFNVVSGDYSPIMEAVVHDLKEASYCVANETQSKMLSFYIESFEKGSIEAHIEGSKEWIQDNSPAVESYIGFIESYQDPFGTRGQWEGFVAVVNRAMSAKFGRLVDLASDLLPLLPWPKEFEKPVFQRPDFTSLDVLAFGSSGIPAGINIPNYEQVRNVFGFKNVSLGNVLSSAYKLGAELVPFVRTEDQAEYKQYVTESFEVQVGLHELLGHGSGRMFMDEAEIAGVVDPSTQQPITTWYGPGETYPAKFAEYSSSYEECRAECVGLFLCVNKTVLEIFGHGEAAEGGSIVFVNWLQMARAGLLALEFYTPEQRKWGQAHMQARHAIFRVLLEAGDDLVKLVPGENWTNVVLDRSKIETTGIKAIGAFLQRLNVYKAAGDFKSAKAMYDHYTTVGDDMLKLRAEVLKNRKPRKVFVQPHLSLDEAEENVGLVEFEPTPAGLIQSFCVRYAPEAVERVRQLADNEQHRHCYEC